VKFVQDTRVDSIECNVYIKNIHLTSKTKEERTNELVELFESAFGPSAITEIQMPKKHISMQLCNVFAKFKNKELKEKNL
jgi:hypothetical protein